MQQESYGDSTGDVLRNNWRLCPKELEMVSETTGVGVRKTGDVLRNNWRWFPKQLEMVSETTGGGVRNNWRWCPKQLEILSGTSELIVHLMQLSARENFLKNFFRTN
jgi:hypothetical protein